MKHRYFFSAECPSDMISKAKIHGVITTTLNVKTNGDLNYCIKEICKQHGLTEEQENKFIFTAFNKL